MSYDEKGRLKTCSIYFSGVLQDSEEYNYDELNRLISVIYYNADGSEGLPSANRYFWYDEDNICHQYGFDTSCGMRCDVPRDAGPIRKP